MSGREPRRTERDLGRCCFDLNYLFHASTGASHGRVKRLKIADYVRDAIDRNRSPPTGVRINASPKLWPIWRLRVEATLCPG